MEGGREGGREGKGRDGKCTDRNNTHTQQPSVSRCKASALCPFAQ
jgi:hypothetical protein